MERDIGLDIWIDPKSHKEKFMEIVARDFSISHNHRCNIHYFYNTNYFHKNLSEGLQVHDMHSYWVVLSLVFCSFLMS